ncbi:MAG: cytochrome c oxidase subunit II [Frankia sp.]|nr:cytochrome c oxidase subunit II [Frankia sp.]
MRRGAARRIFLVNGVLIYAVIRYRRRPDDDGSLPPQTHGNTAAEVTWTVIPLIVVLGLFWLSYTGIKEIDKPHKTYGAVIQVQGFQWFWTFNYGNNVTVKPGPRPEDYPVLVVPYGENIKIVETSDNVIHSFYVPNFLFKRDVVPDRENTFEFRVDVPGVYRGQCAEFCGTGHAMMNFVVRAVTRGEFDKWYAEQKANAGCGATKAAPASALQISSLAGQTQFDKDCLVAKAGAPTTLTFRNGGGLPHNWALFTKAPDAGGQQIVAGKIIQSGSEPVQVPAQQPGSYYFLCQVHPGMNGTYQVR